MSASRCVICWRPLSGHPGKRQPHEGGEAHPTCIRQANNPEAELLSRILEGGPVGMRERRTVAEQVAEERFGDYGRPDPGPGRL